MMICNLINANLIVDLPAAISKHEAIVKLCQTMAEDPRVLDGDALRRAMLQREEMANTGVGSGLAIPHVKIPEVTDFILAIGRSPEGIDYDAPDGQPVHLLFMLAASDQQTRSFIHVLARISEVMREDSVRQELMKAPELETFVQRCQHYEW